MEIFMLSFCNSPARGLYLLIMVLVLAPSCGCAPPTGSVSGTVTYQGKTLPYGRVTFVCAEGTVVSGAIESDGTYAISPVPVGPVKIAVRCLEEAMPALTTIDPSEQPGAKANASPGGAPQGPMMMQSPEKPKSRPKSWRIPDRYQLAEKSGLTYEVQRGNQAYDIRLE
jgi:hypothetical protein